MAAGRTIALATPALLAWARVSAGYDVATVSRTLKITDAVLVAWESGAKSLSMARMRKLAGLYKSAIVVQDEYERERKPAGPVPYFRKALNWSGRRHVVLAEKDRAVGQVAGSVACE